MRKVVPIILLSFVLGFSLISFYPTPSFASGGGKAEKSEGGESDKKGKKNDDVMGGKFEGDPVYVHVQPLILPVITEKGAQQLVVMIIDLRVKNLNQADKIQSNMPRIRDAIIQALYGGLGTGDLRNGVLIDVLRVKNKLSIALDKVVGEGLIEEVLIQGISQRHL